MSDLVICDKQQLVDVADAIRSKTGSSDVMKLDSIDSIIEALKIGGVDGYRMQSGSFVLSEKPTDNVMIYHDPTPSERYNSIAIVFIDLSTSYSVFTENSDASVNALYLLAGMHKYNENKPTSASEPSVIKYGATGSRGYGSLIFPSRSLINIQSDAYSYLRPGVKYTWVRLDYEA